MSEVKVRLSADNSQYKSVLDESVDYAGKVSGKIANKFEFRDVGRTLATSLGLNLESIVDNVARSIAGVSKETEAALKEADRISTEYTNRLIQSNRSKLSLENQYASLMQEQERLRNEASRVYGSSVEANAQRHKLLNAVMDNETEAAVLLGQIEKRNDEEASRRNLQQIAERKVLDDAKERSAEADTKNLEKIGEEDAQWYRERGRLEKELNAQKLEGLSPTERIVEMQRDIVAMQEQQKRYDKDSNEYLSLQVKINTANRDLERERASLAKETASSESAVTSEKTKQYNINTVGRGDNRLTDRELERKIENIKQDIFQRTLAGQGHDLSGDLLLEAQRSNLAQALAERNFRYDVRSTAATQGYDAAFNRYSGLSESRLREILQGGNLSNSQLLGEIRDLLRNKGIRTIPIEPPGG